VSPWDGSGARGEGVGGGKGVKAMGLEAGGMWCDRRDRQGGFFGGMAGMAGGCVSGWWFIWAERVVTGGWG
jgi:hypothetical protein